MLYWVINSGYYKSRGMRLGNVKEKGMKPPYLKNGEYLAEVCATLGMLKEVNETCEFCKFSA